MLSAIKLDVVMCYYKCHYAKCHYAKCHYAKCRGAFFTPCLEASGKNAAMTRHSNPMLRRLNTWRRIFWSKNKCPTDIWPTISLPTAIWPTVINLLSSRLYTLSTKCLSAKWHLIKRRVAVFFPHTLRGALTTLFTSFIVLVLIFSNLYYYYYTITI